jgi:hypothetical protein
MRCKEGPCVEPGAAALERLCTARPSQASSFSPSFHLKPPVRRHRRPTTTMPTRPDHHYPKNLDTAGRPCRVHSATALSGWAFGVSFLYDFPFHLLETLKKKELATQYSAPSSHPIQAIIILVCVPFRVPRLGRCAPPFLCPPAFPSPLVSCRRAHSFSPASPLPLSVYPPFGTRFNPHSPLTFQHGDFEMGC